VAENRMANRVYEMVMKKLSANFDLIPRTPVKAPGSTFKISEKGGLTGPSQIILP
jgi:hypothetical protein